MKKLIFKSLSFLLVCLVAFACTKDDMPEPQQSMEEIAIIEMAYPGQTGELVTIGEGDYEMVVQKINGEFVYNGDILLTPQQIETIEDMSKGLKAFGQIYNKWPNLTIPYTLASNISNSQKSKINSAIAHWNKNCDVKWKPRKKESGYVQFYNNGSGGSSSYLGRIGGKQLLRLSSGASTGTAIHEMGHAAGLWHEHQRPDRDKHIIVKWDNIRSSWRSQFSKGSIASNKKKNTGFDFGSLMIYPSYVSSAVAYNSKKPVKKKKNGGTWKANRTALSNKDKRCINKMY